MSTPVQPILPGFALMASYSPEGDTALPFAASLIALPNPAVANFPVTLMWTTFNVAAVRITSTSIDTGTFSARGGSAVYLVHGGLPSSTDFLMTCYDAEGSILIEIPLIVTVT